MSGMPSFRTKVGWWLDSVRGLRSHVDIYRHMRRAYNAVPPGQRSPEAMAQLRAQEGMVGHCLLHVLLVHEVGSGRFWD